MVLELGASCGEKGLVVVLKMVAVEDGAVDGRRVVGPHLQTCGRHRPSVGRALGSEWGPGGTCRQTLAALPPLPSPASSPSPFSIDHFRFLL